MNNLCGNCFAELNGTVCTKCGYKNTADIQEPYALAAGTVLKDRYLLGKIIGKGGFGITYLSYDTKLDKTVAVKEYFPIGTAVRTSDNTEVEVLASEQRQVFLERMEKFESEAKLISGFEGKADIIKVFDAFKANGTAYCVMEFVNGVTLKQYIQDNGKISGAQAVYILKKILASLAILHKSSVLHRDISPENIMLDINGGVKLIDFGSARQLSNEGEDSLSVILKPGFAPMEQYQRKGNQGPWTDLYALGLSIYYALTLKIPEDPMTRLDNDDVFLKGLEELSPELRRIIKKSAEVKKNDRYSCAEDMLGELEKCGIKEEGFGEIKVKTPDKTKPSFRRRHKKKIAVIAASLAAVAAILFAVPSAKDIIAYYQKPDTVRIGDVFYPIDSESLDLSDLELTNASIANLKHMKKLKELNLNDNYITDLSVLDGLDNMESLHFNNNNVSDISFAAGMDDLEKISAENSGVYDISPLKGKTKLKEVFFGNTYVTDITPISDSRGLQKVGFNEAQIGSIDALDGMTELEMVCLSGCGIYSVEPLAESKKLKYVYIGRNNVSDLSPLKNCESISELFVDNNPIKNSLDTFEGITVNGYVTIDSNGVTPNEAWEVFNSMNGKFSMDY